MHVLLSVWSDLYDAGERDIITHDRLGFDPFSEMSLQEMKARFTSSSEGADAVSPSALLPWVAASGNVITHWAPPIFKAIELYRGGQFGGTQATISSRRLQLSISLDEDLVPGMPRIWLSCKDPNPAQNDPRSVGRRNLGWFVSHLMTACAVAIASFVPTNFEAIVELQSNDMIEPTSGRFELILRRDPSGAALLPIPLPAIAASAFQVLVRLTAPSRGGQVGSLFKFRWDAARDSAQPPSSRVRFPRGQYLQDFAAVHSLPTLIAGTKVTGDQFGAGFYLAYVHAVPGAKLEELGAFVGSKYPGRLSALIRRGLPGSVRVLRAGIKARVQQARASGDWDGADNSRGDRRLLAELMRIGRLADDIRLAEFMERADGIADGSDVPGGGGAGKLIRDVEQAVTIARADGRLRGSNHPEAEREIRNEALAAVYGKYSFDAHPEGHVVCTCRTGISKDLATAECLKRKAASRFPWAADKEVVQDACPDTDYAGVTTCFGGNSAAPAAPNGQGCSHAIAFASNRAVMLRKSEEFKEAAASADTPGARARATALVADIMAAIDAAAPRRRSPK